MGLLDKASHSQTETETSGSLLQKADTTIKKKIIGDEPLTDVKWLTQHSFQIPAESENKNNSAPFFTPEEKSIIAKITELSEGVETPGQIYTLLKEELTIEKGAFLVQESQNDIFMPWALTGYDTTTRSRLRIPRSALISYFSHSNSGYLFIESEDERLFLRPFFSIREFGLLEKVLLCPFIHDQEIIGFLLITESPSLLDDSMDRSLSFIQNVVKTASPVLYYTRERKLKNISLQQPNVKSDLKHEMELFYTSVKHDKREIIFLVFSIQEAVDQIHQYVGDADVFRIRHDLSGILTSMLSDTGGVHVLNDSLLLLIVSGKSLRDESLLVHQISLALNDFTQKELDVGNLIKDTLINPGSIQELIQFTEKWM